jgi:hypothetical protein
MSSGSKLLCATINSHSNIYIQYLTEFVKQIYGVIMSVPHYCPQNVAVLPPTKPLESPSALQLATQHFDIALMLVCHTSLLDLMM